MTVQFVKAHTTATEFDNWQIYFRQRSESHEKADYYAASVVSAVFNSQGARTSIKDHLLEFGERRTSQAESKSAWGAVLGVEMQ